jgi:flavin reductase (DIM6/NTAB) family NADH-FMN oxidoreductase RutF/rubredoxin
MDNAIMFKLTYGLFVLTAKDGEKTNGCIINTAMQQTSTPNVISITVNKQNFTEQMVKKTGKFNISFLDESAAFGTFTHFGFQSGKNVDKFADFADAKMAANGIPYIAKGTNAYLSCEVKESFDLGTHTLFLADVKDGEILSDKPSVTYTYYQENIKPKPQKPAETKPAGRIWVCKICGYEYDEAKEGKAFEDLPADWTCPICKHGKQDFELLV